MSLLEQIKSDKKLFVVIIISLVNVLCRIPFVSIPAFGDEINYFNGVTAISENNLNPFVLFWGYKPPVVFIVPALAHYFLGPSLIWGRLITYIYSSIILIFVYLFGKKLFSATAGLFCTIILFIYPLFMVQTQLFNDSIPFAAFFLVSLYFYYSRKLNLYMISATLLVLTKEPGVLLPVFIFIYEMIGNYKLSIHQIYVRFIRSIKFLVPIGIFFLWIILNRYYLGWYLWPINTSYFDLDAISRSFAYGEIFGLVTELFVKHSFWMLFSVVVTGMIYISVIHNPFTKSVLKIMQLIFCLCIGYFIFHLCGPKLPRYFLFLYPPIILLFSGILINYVLRKQIRYSIIGIICFCFFLSNMYFSVVSKNFESSENSFIYIRYISFTKNYIQRLHDKYQNTIFIAPSFLKEALENPVWGYSKYSNFVYWSDCDDLKRINIADSLRIKFSSPSADVVYIAPPLTSWCPDPEKGKIIEKICFDKYSDSYYCVRIYGL